MIRRASRQVQYPKSQGEAAEFDTSSPAATIVDRYQGTSLGCDGEAAKVRFRGGDGGRAAVDGAGAGSGGFDFVGIQAARQPGVRNRDLTRSHDSQRANPCSAQIKAPKLA